MPFNPSKLSSMRRVGLIGGSSWASSVDYYKYINQMVNDRLGGKESARLTLDSMNFGDLVRCNEAEDWDGVNRMLRAAARRLKASEAEGLVICANTLHLHAQGVPESVDLPLIHIAHAAAAAIAKQGLTRVALLGTRWTMEQDVYHSILGEMGIEIMIPESGEREFIHESIFNELGRNVFKPETKARYLRIVGEVLGRGAQGVILGCTEIPMLVSPEEIPAPAFDTTRLHAAAAVDFALGS